MAGELLNMAYAWAGVVVVAAGVLTTMMVTDSPDENGTASNITAVAVILFSVALVATLTL